MLKTISKPPEAEGKEHGRLMEHYITLEGRVISEGRVILSVDEYNGYYIVSWDTNLSGYEGYTTVLEMHKSLQLRENPQVNLIFGESQISVPLSEFQKAGRPQGYFHDPRFLLFGLVGNEPDVPNIFYDRRSSRSFAVVSRHRISDFIAHYSLRTMPYHIGANAEDLRKELDKILDLYKPR